LRLLHRWLARFLLLVGYCLAGPVISMGGAQAALVLPETGTLALNREPQALVPRGSVAIADAAAGRLDERLAPARRRIVPFAGDNELWIKVQLRNPASRPMAWHLDYRLPSIDEVTLFERRGGAWTEQSAGDRVAQSEWPRPARYPRFLLDFGAGQERVLFVRVRNAFPAPVPLRVIGEIAGDAAEESTNVGFGVVLGALALLVAACLVQATLYRDASYFLYAAYTLLLGLSFASHSGLAGQHLWGDYVRWNDVAKAVFPVAGAGVAVWLVRAMCRVSVRQRALSRISVWIGSILIAIALGMALLGQIVVWLVALAMLLAACTVLYIAVSTWRRGDPMGGWVLMAAAPLSAVTGLVVLRSFGLAPFEFDANLVVSAAIAAVLPLLLVAIYLQSRELLAVQVRARELASTDALTGLLTPHLFGDRVRAAVGRYRRSGHNVAVLYVRLVNAAWIRETHGGAVVEQSMIRSVIKLRRQMPDADCLGRVDETTMGLILESVTMRRVIMERAARVVAHGLMPLAGLKPNVTLQFHVVANILADNPLDADELQAALAATLSSMSPRTRRPIRFLEPGSGVPPPGQEDDTGLGALAA
jgi:GGDEF domain-containing protein